MWTVKGASWPGLLAAVCLAAACAPENDDGTSRGPQNDNYGEALIGYKDGRGAQEAEGAGSRQGGAVSDPASSEGDGWGGAGGGGNGGDIDNGWSESSDAGASAYDAGLEHDAGVEQDAGRDAGHIGEDAGHAGDGGAVGPYDAGTVNVDDGGRAAVDASTPTEPPADRVPENPFFSTSDEPTSTFGLDVDTGAYTLARAAINAGRLPVAKSVRIEEFLNYFHFHYAQPKGETPFALYTELADCPWNDQRKLLMLGVQGQEVKLVDQPAANLVFLLDVSGSMSDPGKLPLLKKGFRMLAKQMRPQDRISIVTYAGSDQVVLEAAHGDEHERIVGALDLLEAGGSTNGEGGIQRAYQIAEEHFIEGGNNRVLLATDGDFNVGINDIDQLVQLISEKRDSGVFLSVYGFGEAWDGGNYQDETMEQLANNGNGIYFFIDSPEEARRAFLSTVSGSLLTIAKDVKVQVELSPEEVKAYRLIGYENRVIANEDFNDDAVDGGELGAGLSMTALYEIIPAGSNEDVPEDELGTAPAIEGSGADGGGSDESVTDATVVAKSRAASRALVQLRVRYKGRDASSSELLEQSYDTSIQRAEPTAKLSFAAAVSELAIHLRGSQYTTRRPLSSLLPQIDAALSLDKEGAIAELRTLVEKVMALEDSEEEP